jgi:hypothetical protein
MEECRDGPERGVDAAIGQRALSESVDVDDLLSLETHLPQLDDRDA